MTGALILIVEDNDKNLKLARDLLQHYGFRTLEADTAATGIALAEQHVPDLILMDIQLPDMDGVTALGRLRESARPVQGVCLGSERWACTCWIYS